MLEPIADLAQSVARPLSLAGALAAASVAAFLGGPAHAAPGLVHFEEFSPPPSPLVSQYCVSLPTNRGVEFQTPAHVTPAPVTTSSPPNAATTAAGSEFDAFKTLQIGFTDDQFDVSVKAGLDRAYAYGVVAHLRAYHSLTPDPAFLADTDSVYLGTGPGQILHELSVSHPLVAIRSVEIEFLESGGSRPAFEWIDDLTYTRIGPVCISDTVAPSVQIELPFADLEMLHERQVRLAFTGRDAESGVASLEVQWLQGGSTLVDSFFACGAPGGPACQLPGDEVHYDFLAGVPDLVPQVLTLRVIVRDYAGFSASADRKIDYALPGAAVNIWALGMEITQGIQPWVAQASARRGGAVPVLPYGASGTRLIAGKRTAVRVYGGIEGSSHPMTGAKAVLTCQTASLGPCPGPSFVNPAFRITLDPAHLNDLDTLRDDAARSFDFWLPDAWTELSQIRLRATLTPPAGVPECPGCQDGANAIETSGITFFAQPALEITPLFVCVRRDPSYARDLCDEVAPTTAQTLFGLLSSSFVQAYPVAEADIRIVPRASGHLLVDGDFGVAGAPLTKDLYYDLMDGVCNIRDDDAPPANRVYVALIPSPAGVGGLGRPGAMCATVTVDPANLGGAARTASQEVGHALGLDYHVSCDHGEDVKLRDGSRAKCLDYPAEFPCAHGGICTHGFDTASLIALAPNPRMNHVHDFMSYGSTPIASFIPRPFWISPFTFDAISDEISTLGATAAQAPQNAPTSPPRADAPRARNDVLWLRGALSFDSGDVTGRFDPFYRLQDPAIGSDPGAGEFTLELEDAGGDVLETRSFDGRPVLAHDCCGGDDPSGLPVSFLEVVPLATGTSRAVLRRGGDLLAELDASRSTPTVTILEPTAGSYWSADERFEIIWDANDDDGDPLVALVQYSADDGATWATMDIDVESSSLPVDPKRVAGSAAARVRVLVSDGMNSGSATSDAFEVEGKPPEVWIGAPVEIPFLFFSLAEEGEPVIFQGGGSDVEDGPLAGAQLAWTSDLDGALGSGERLEIANLVPGLHSVTLVGTDGDGQSAFASTLVWVLGRLNAQPVADAGPDLFGVAGDSISIDGSASFDPDGDPLTWHFTLAAKPLGSVAQLVGTGLPAATLHSDAPGTYEVALVVGDGSVNSPSDHTSIVLQPAGGEPACANGFDDDGDGLIDSDDPGCPVPEATLENPKCDDGIDNDGDGLVDFEDPQCTLHWPYWESPTCGLGAELVVVLGALGAWRRRGARRWAPRRSQRQSAS